MRQLKNVHPDFADNVDILGVGVDPGEDASDIQSYIDTHGFIWDMALADTDMLESYKVRQQAGYMALDANGVIVASLTYGPRSDDGWRELFEELANP